MATFIYTKAKLKLVQGVFDFSTDNFKMMLVTSAYVPSQANHDFRDDVTNELAAGSGYTAGGNACTFTPVISGTGVNFGLVDTVWPVLTATFRAGVIYKARGGASSADELWAYLDFGSDQAPVGVDFTAHPSTDLNLG